MGRLLLLGAGGGGGTTQTPSSLLTGLVGYYNMNEASGASALDSLGTNNLANNGTVGSAAGRVGTSRTFGTGNYFLAATSSVYTTVLSNGNSFTVAFWAYPTATTASAMVWGKDAQAGVRIGGGSSWQFGNLLSFNLTVASSLTTGAWQLVLARYDSAAHTFGLSVNNGAYSGSRAASNAGASASAKFAVGAHVNSADVLNAGTEFPGRIDELGIWSRVLTADEETTLYNAGAGTTYPF